MTARNSRGGIKKTGKNKGGSGVVSPAGKKINYNFDSTKETASQYHARIGQERGDSAAYVKGMQRGAKTAFSERGLDANKLNAAGTAIPVSDLTPAAPVPMPSTPIPTDPGNVVGANNAGLATASNGMLTFDATSNQLVPNTQGTTPTATDNFSSLFNQYMGMQEAPPNTADLYAKEAKDAQLKQKQESVNSYTAQLNSIVAKSQADQLRLEGQGRGITDVIIGGQQAQINREAAIAALPVQAQLAAAQGDLEMAQLHVDKMFQIKSQDAQAQYQYKSKVVDAVYNFATTQEQRRLDALKVQEDRKYAEQQDFLKTQRTLLSSALQQGASSSVINAINGATTQEDVLIAAGQYNGDVLARRIKEKQLADMFAPSGSGKRDTQVVDGKLIDMQTGEIISNITTGGDGQSLVKVTPKEIQNINDTQIATNSLVTLADTMIKSIKDYGTKVYWGGESGKRSAAKTNLLLSMKNLEKTGALDAGTIKVLEGTIPDNKFFATEAAQIAALEQLKDTVLGKTTEYIGSYRGTTAEVDPRTERIFKASVPSFDASLFDATDYNDIDKLFGGTSSGAFNPASFY